jgi:hypothetical protein
MSRQYHFVAPNGLRVSGERRAEGDERVRCTRMLGGMVSNLIGYFGLAPPSQNVTVKVRYTRTGSPDSLHTAGL